MFEDVLECDPDHAPFMGDLSFSCWDLT